MLDQIRAMNAFENTLIFFLSDNGASAEMMIRDDGHDPKRLLARRPRIFAWVRAGQRSPTRPSAATRPGCTREASQPRSSFTGRKESRARGELRHDAGHVIDLVPTILEVAGAAGSRPGKARPFPRPPGISLVPSFARDDAVHHAELWWSHEGNRAIRVGDWKLVAARNQDWELYDLASDRTETRDLARSFPKKSVNCRPVWGSAGMSSWH